MAQITAIDWGAAPLRLISATIRDRQVTITRMEELADASQEKTTSLVETLKSWRTTKPNVLIVVDRSDCEVRAFGVPPVPPEELPDIVNFQAIQHFGSLEDGSPIDYLSTEGGESPQVLAAALPAKRLESIEQACETIGAHLLGVIFKPCATAAAVEHALQEVGSEAITRVILTEKGTTADLTVAHGPLVLLSRSIRLSTPDGMSGEEITEQDLLAASRDFIINEIKRTLAATRVQLTSGEVQSLIICGNTPTHQRLADACRAKLDLPVQIVSGPQRWRREGAARTISDAEAEAFAPLVGAALLEANKAWPSIDFVRPRQAPQPTDQRQLWTTVATALLSVTLLIGLTIWWGLSSRDADIRGLRRQEQEIDQLVEVADRQRRELEAIDDWYLKSPNWLYELRELSRKLPGPEEMKLQRLQADITTSGGGRITMQGVVTRSEVIADLEESLRDEQHRVEGMDRNFTGEDEKYPWYFVEKIEVSAARAAEIVARLKSEPMPTPELQPASRQSSAGATDRATEAEHAGPADDAPLEQTP